MGKEPIKHFLIADIFFSIDLLLNDVS